MIREILTSDICDLDATIEKIRHAEAAPSYLVLCSPDKVALLEKDYLSAKVKVDDHFIPCTNHDDDLDDWTEQEYEEWGKSTHDVLLLSSRIRKETALDLSHHVKTFEDIKSMTQTWPVLNTLTTFGVIMSPERGTIDWGAWYKERPIPPRGMEQWGGEFTPAGRHLI